MAKNVLDISNPSVDDSNPNVTRVYIMGTPSGGGTTRVGGVYKSAPNTYTDGQTTDFLTDEYGQQKVVVVGTSLVQGPAAAGQAASGNPLRNGVVVRPLANKQTRTNGNIGDATSDENENAWVRESYVPGYEDNVANVAKVEQRFSPFNISSATTTVVKSGAGHLHQLRVAGGTLGNVTVYDNTAASGTVIVPTVTPAAAGVLIENVTFANGLTIVTAAATIITGAYR